MKSILSLLFCAGFLFPIITNAQQEGKSTGISLDSSKTYAVPQEYDAIKWGSPHIMPVSIMLPRLKSFRIHSPVFYDDSMEWSAPHRVPVSILLPPLEGFPICSSVFYAEDLSDNYFKKMIKN